MCVCLFLCVCVRNTFRTKPKQTQSYFSKFSDPTKRFPIVFCDTGHSGYTWGCSWDARVYSLTSLLYVRCHNRGERLNLSKKNLKMFSWHKDLTCFHLNFHRSILGFHVPKIWGWNGLVTKTLSFFVLCCEITTAHTQKQKFQWRGTLIESN